jgi:hypothetical protein
MVASSDLYHQSGGRKACTRTRQAAQNSPMANKKMKGAGLNCRMTSCGFDFQLIERLYQSAYVSTMQMTNPNREHGLIYNLLNK